MSNQAEIVPLITTPGNRVEEIKKVLDDIRQSTHRCAAPKEVDEKILRAARVIGNYSKPLKEAMGSKQAKDLVLDHAEGVLIEIVEGEQDKTTCSPDEVKRTIRRATQTFDEEIEALNILIEELCSTSDLKTFMETYPGVVAAIFDKGIPRWRWDGSENDEKMPESVREKGEEDERAIVECNVNKIIAADSCSIGEDRLRKFIMNARNEYIERKKEELKAAPSAAVLLEVVNQCEYKELGLRETAALAVEFALREYNFFRTTDGEAYVAMDVAGDGKLACVKMDIKHDQSMYWRELNKAHLYPQLAKSKIIAQGLCYEAQRSGTLVHRLVWLDMAPSGCVYLHPHDGSNQVVRVSKHSVTLVENGTNQDEVFLTTSPQVEVPFEIDPHLSANKTKKGIRLLRDHVVHSAACSPKNQNLLAAWFVSVFVRRLFGTKAQIAGHGDQSQGKSAAASYWHLLEYGVAEIADATASAAHVLRSKEPIHWGDDEEDDDLTEAQKRANRRASTGASRVMRDASSNDGLVIQRAQSMRFTNSITPMNNNPDRSRTLVVHFDVGKYGSDNHDDFFIRQSILGNRGLIWSALMQLVKRNLLPTLANAKEMTRVRTALRKRLKGHPKHRLMEHLVVMHAALTSLNNQVKFCAVPDAEVFSWIKEQAYIEATTATETDDVVANLLIVAHRVVGKDPDEEKEWRDVHDWQVSSWILGPKNGVEGHKKVVGWKATSEQLLILISRARRDAGLMGKLPFKNAGSLGSRLGNSVRVGTLADANWQVTPPPKKATSSKRAWTIIPPADLVHCQREEISDMAPSTGEGNEKEVKKPISKHKRPISKHKRPMAKACDRGKGGRVAAKVAGEKTE